MKNRFPLCLALLISLSSFAVGQDPAVLRTPNGAHVALIVFEDLECPKCSSDAPLEAEAARAHKFPLVRHDFPLPMHNWSFNAAVIARYFDTQSKPLGNQFRDYIFEHQPEFTPDNLQIFAANFAADPQLDMPFGVNLHGTQGALADADKAYGGNVTIETRT